MILQEHYQSLRNANVSAVLTDIMHMHINLLMAQRWHRECTAGFCAPITCKASFALLLVYDCHCARNCLGTACNDALQSQTV